MEKAPQKTAGLFLIRNSRLAPYPAKERNAAASSFVMPERFA